MPRYVLRVTMLAVVPQLLISTSLVVAGMALSPDGTAPQIGASMEASWRDAFGSIVFSPVVETLLLSLLLAGLRMTTSRVRVRAGVVALLAGLLHGTRVPLWFFPSVWLFFVLSLAYEAWRPRSRKHAFVAAMVPHMAINGSVVVMVAITTKMLSSR